MNKMSNENASIINDACELPRAGPASRISAQSAPGMTRLAVMGGAYGSVPALLACLSHARQNGCDTFAFIGDATGCYGHSDEIVSLVRDQFSIRVAGNHEQQAAARSDSCGCNYASEEDEHYGALAHQYAMKSLSDANRAWLGTWPDLVVLETPAGKLLLCHGSPAQTNEFLYESQLDDQRLIGWLNQFGARGLICTHSGFPWLRALGEGRFAANCGVVGRADHDHDAAVHYASIEIQNGRFAAANIERVEYDHLTYADQLYNEGVDDVFSTPVRNGVWTCGLRSAPPPERVMRARQIAPLILI